MKFSIECHWALITAILVFILFWGRGGAQPAPQPQPSPAPQQPTAMRKTKDELDAEVLTAMGLELVHE